ncbi:hypothetical protein O3M35_003562 [Rhynocoris fuscipes]|uniref:Major facilitator superfamily (MFS) profile domain-containing protein n=1 Tax=Rhynocoris fuscipes TaxID=488301 RepID=A0AAW1CR74_9HEMI
MSWAAIFFPKVRSGEVGRTFSILEESLIASFTHVGQLCATFPSGYLQNKVGRRCTLLIINQAQLCAWTLIYLSRTFWAIIISRFLMGSYAGFTATCCPAYAGEIALPSIRGRLSSLLTLSFVAGLLFQTSVGSYISYDSVAIVSFCITIMHFIALINIPESPYSLIRLGKVEQAENNLKWLRGRKNVDEDFKYIKFHIDLQMTRKTSYKDIFRWKASRNAFIQVIALILVQRLTGFLALASFTSQIFPEDWSIFKSEKYPMIWNGINFTFLLISFCILDRVDRKVLLQISTTGCAIFSTTLATWFYLYEMTTINMSKTIWIPYIVLSLHAAIYSFGLFFIPIVFLGEIFPMNVKTKSITLTTFISYIAVIFMVQIFLPLKNYFGMYSNFVLYAIAAFIGCYVCSRITETRNRSLEHIQGKLEGMDSETYRTVRAARESERIMAEMEKR